MKYKLVYNPKKFDKKINTAKVVFSFGAREGGRPSGKLIEKSKLYRLGINELKKFRTDIADYILGKYGFLQEIKPDEVDRVLKEMKDKQYKCKLCDFETDTPIALKGHMRSHKLSEEAQKVLATIPEAKPEAYVVGAEFSGSGQTEFIRPEAMEGLPQTSSDDPRTKGAEDRDGVEWYGTGLQSQRKKGGQVANIRSGTPGQRPARRPAFAP